MKKHYKYLDETLGYIYFRLNGKRIALPGTKGSPEFDAAYDKLFAEAQRTKAVRQQESKRRTEQREQRQGRRCQRRVVYPEISGIRVFCRPARQGSNLCAGHTEKLSSGFGAHVPRHHAGYGRTDRQGKAR